VATSRSYVSLQRDEAFPLLWSGQQGFNSRCGFNSFSRYSFQNGKVSRANCNKNIEQSFHVTTQLSGKPRFHTSLKRSSLWLTFLFIYQVCNYTDKRRTEPFNSLCIIMIDLFLQFVVVITGCISTTCNQQTT